MWNNSLISLLYNHKIVDYKNGDVDFDNFNAKHARNRFGITIERDVYLVIFHSTEDSVKPIQKCIVCKSINNAFNILNDLKRKAYLYNLFIARV